VLKNTNYYLYYCYKIIWKLYTYYSKTWLKPRITKRLSNREIILYCQLYELLYRTNFILINISPESVINFHENGIDVNLHCLSNFLQTCENSLVRGLWLLKRMTYVNFNKSKINAYVCFSCVIVQEISITKSIWHLVTIITDVSI
jgi:hypothetical protein